MDQIDREKKSQRFFYALIIVLLLGYAGLKSWHVLLAFNAYQGQPIERNTSGAAK